MATPLMTIIGQSVRSQSRAFSALTPAGVLVFFQFGECVAIATKTGWRFLRFEKTQNWANRNGVVSEMEMRIEEFGWARGQEWVLSSEREWEGLETTLSTLLKPEPPPPAEPVTAPQSLPR